MLGDGHLGGNLDIVFYLFAKTSQVGKQLTLLMGQMVQACSKIKILLENCLIKKGTLVPQNPLERPPPRSQEPLASQN